MASVDIELKNVIKEFTTRGGDLVRAVDDISLEIYKGEFFALLGPSGCGKTTTLRMIAGFEDTSSGQILIRGQAVQNVPPFHRPVNTVFQDYALFPHMTVLKNVMFGLEMSRVPKQIAKQRALEALELVRLPQAADRKPRQLSGGQQQRVALARALVNEPAVLLLDEPLGALDLKLRKAMQFELKEMQQELGITFIYVTHDQEEALTMADRIAVMDQGHVLQIGKPEEVYDSPATRFVADFIGETNFLTGKIASRNGEFGKLSLDAKTTVEGVLADDSIQSGQAVTLAIRPEKVTIYGLEEANPVTSNDDNVTLLEGIVLQSFYIGTDTRYVVSIGENSELAVRMQNYGNKYDTIYKNGQRVNVFWDNDYARILAH